VDDKVVPLRRRKVQTREERIMDWFERYSSYLTLSEEGSITNEEVIIQGVELRAEALEIKGQSY
jgi:hypothetical protein